MKHKLSVTVILIAFFFITQVVGLATINKHIDVSINPTTGESVVSHPATPLGPAPELKQEEKDYGFVPVLIAILIGTGLLLLIIKFSLGMFWKFWFLLSVFITMTISFDVYIPAIYAASIALILGIIKVFRPNIIVHNFTEIFTYTGITIILLPFLNLFSAFLLLFFISLYDMYAVWKSKHMISLAKFQTEHKVFAGLYIPYNMKAVVPKLTTKPKKVKSTARDAILGGGDIAFPMIFGAVVMESLIREGMAKLPAFLETLIIIISVTAALAFLLYNSKKDKFYPAMPFLTLGCIFGFLIIYFLNFIF